MAMKGAKSVFLDTNILVKANISTAPLHQETLRLFQKFWDENYELWISRQILREYLSTVTRVQTFMQP